MKRRLFTASVIVLMFCAIAFSSIYLIRKAQREAQLDAVRKSVVLLLDIEGLALNDGYFSWSEVRGLVESGDLENAALLLEDAQVQYPFIAGISIDAGTPPEASFEIHGEGRQFVMKFSIKDDFGFHPLPDKVATVRLDAEQILDAYNIRGNLVLNSSGREEIAYAIKASFSEPLLALLDYLLVAIASSAAAFPISFFLRKRSLFFYETKGLESIIFLFEQTERGSASHSRRVAALAIFVAEYLGYKGKRLRNLYTAALLHDIGKISITSSILLKDSPLDSKEQQIMMTHPIVSARILRNFKELAHLSPIVLYHHERMDGSGYPEGLKGEEIPEESRIIAVIDVFEALIGSRPYREPIAPAAAFAQMREMALDGKIIDVLEAHYASFDRFEGPKWMLPFYHAGAFERI